MAENKKSYAGKIKNSGVQFVTSLFGSGNAPKPKKHTGKDLRSKGGGKKK